MRFRITGRGWRRSGRRSYVCGFDSFGGEVSSRWTWERFMERLGVLLPEIRILHPYPNVRFDAKYPR